MRKKLLALTLSLALFISALPIALSVGAEDEPVTPDYYVAVDFDHKNFSSNDNTTYATVLADSPYTGNHLLFNRGSNGVASVNGVYAETHFATTGKADEEALVMYIKASAATEIKIYLFNSGRNLKAAAGAIYYTVSTAGVKTEKSTTSDGFVPGSGFEGWLVIPYAAFTVNHWGGATGQAVTSGAVNGIYFGCSGAWDSKFYIDNIGFTADTDAFLATVEAQSDPVSDLVHNWEAADCLYAEHCSVCLKSVGEPTGVHTFENGVCSVCSYAYYDIAEDFADLAVTGVANTFAQVDCLSPYGQALKLTASPTGADNKTTVTFDKKGTANHKALVFYYDTTLSATTSDFTLVFIPRNSNGAGLTLSGNYEYFVVTEAASTPMNSNDNFKLKLPGKSKGWAVLPIARDDNIWGYGGAYGDGTGSMAESINDMAALDIHLTNTSATVVLDQFGFTDNVEAFKTLAATPAVLGGYTGLHNWTEATCAAPKTCTICGATEGEANDQHTWVGGTCTVCDDRLYDVAEDFTDMSVSGASDAATLVNCVSPYGQALKFTRPNDAGKISIAFDAAGTAEHQALVFYYDNTCSAFNGDAAFSFIPRRESGGQTLTPNYTYYTVIDGELSEAHPSGNFTLTLPRNTAGWVVLPLPADGTWGYDGAGCATTDGLVSVDLQFIHYAGASMVVDQFGFTSYVDLFKNHAATGLSHLNGYTGIGHTYDGDSCTLCGDTEATGLSAYLGYAVNADWDALRFAFTLQVSGVTKGADYSIEDGSEPKITLNNVTYTVVEMGGIISNKSATDLIFADVDGKRTLRIEAKKVMEALDTEVTYAIGVKGIPDTKYGAPISCRPYLTYWDGEKQVTIYGKIITRSVNNYLKATGQLVESK